MPQTTHGGYSQSSAASGSLVGRQELEIASFMLRHGSGVGAVHVEEE